MTIPNSNVSMQDIEDEFGGSGSISLNEYYKGGANVPSGVDDPNTIPTQGTISIGDFRGASNAFTYTVTSSTQNLNLRSGAVSAGWDGSSALTVIINSNVYIWSDTTSTAAMIISGSFPGGLSITNNGKIMGKGGNGAPIGATAQPTDGGPAISCSSTCTINNSSSGYIGGGGGGGAPANYNVSGTRPSTSGGGGGAGGGQGGSGTFYNPSNGLVIIALGGDGGSIGQSGSDADNFRTFYGSGNTQADILPPGGGGGAGGGGGNGTTSNSTASGGGGGGRIFPGTGGTTSGGVSGGSAGNAGGDGTSVDAAGGGGWGAAGGDGNLYSGGAGGAAITGSGYTVTGTTSQIYGDY